MIVGNEPNLNRFWLPQFNPDGTDAAAPAYLALLAQTYDAIKARRPGDHASGAAHSRPAASTEPNTGRDTHSPTAFISRPGRGVPRQRPHAAGHGRARLPPVRRRRRTCSPTSHIRTRRRSASPTTTEARDAPRPGVRRNRAGGIARCRSSTTSSASSRRSPQAKAKPLHRHRADDDEARRRDRPRRRTTRRPCSIAFCQPNVVGILLFHSQDENGARELAVGRLLRRRHAEVEPLRRPRRARPGPRRLDRPLRRARARRRPDRPALPQGCGAPRRRRGDPASRARSTVSASLALTRARREDRVRAGRPTRSPGSPIASRSKGRKLGAGRYAFSGSVVHPVNPGTPALTPERDVRHPLSVSHARTRTIGRVSEKPAYERIEGLPGRPVRLVLVLQGRSRLAPPPDRGARRRQGGVRRGRRGLGRAGWRACGPTTPPASGPRRTSSSGRSPSATTTCSSSAPTLNGTPLAGWLTTPYSYLATTKPSVYTDKKRVRQGRVIPRNAPVSRRLPVREAPALVLPHLRGARRRRCGSTRRSAASS